MPKTNQVDYFKPGASAVEYSVRNTRKITSVAENFFDVSNAVLPNLCAVAHLCAAAHKCAARAVEVCRGRISEMKSFQWEVSVKFSTVIENIWLNTSTARPLHHNMVIWPLNSSSVIICDDLYCLSLYGRFLSSLDRSDLLFPKSRTSIIAYASVAVEPDIIRHCFWAFVNFFWFRRQVKSSQISFIAWKIRKIGEASADTDTTETYYMKGCYNLEEEMIKVKI